MSDKPFVKLSNGDTLYFDDSKRIINGELTIQKFFNGYSFASRTSIINHLVSKFNFKTYLEIGVRRGDNFKKINIESKIGVDPDSLYNSEFIIKETSDNFFQKNKSKFDIIFIDGLHLEFQVDKDITNALNALNTNGYVIMHDCNPPSEFHQRENYEIDGKFPAWNGTVWKSFVKLHMSSDNLRMYCVDCDWGIGIIKKGKSKKLKNKQQINYENLEKNRKELLNLISVKEFLNIF